MGAWGEGDGGFRPPSSPQEKMRCVVLDRRVNPMELTVVQEELALQVQVPQGLGRLLKGLWACRYLRLAVDIFFSRVVVCLIYWLPFLIVDHIGIRC